MIRQAQAVDAYNLSQATQSYSLFQPFNVSHGSSYVLSIEAKAVGLSSSDATCSLALCANHECSSPATLTSNYMRYSFTFTMFIIANSIDVMYSVSCSGAAYVALDDAGAYNIGFARAVAASTIYATQYILDNVTLTASGSVLTSTAPGQVVNRTIFSSLPAATRTTTVLLSASEVVETAYSYVTASLTLLASTLTTTLVEEVTATSQLPQTTLIETSIEAPSTYFETTTLPGVTETRTNTPARDTLVLNVTQYPAAAVVTDTTTILSEYTRSIPPGTLTATETLSPGTTTQNVTQYAAASTLTVPTTVVSEYTTSLPGYTTEIDFTFLLTTTLVAQTTTVVSEYTTTLPGYTSTEVETTTLPAATLTVTEETTAMVASSTSAMTATTTLPTSTIASTTSSVAPTPLVTLTINNNGCGTIYIGQQQDFSEMPDPETVSFVGGPYSGDTIQVAAAPNVMLQFTVDQSLEPVWQSYDHFNEIQTGNPAQYNVPNNVPSEILSVTCYPGAQYTIVNYCVSSVVSSQITVRDATLNYYLGQVNAYMESYAQGVFAIQPGNTLELSANVYGSFTPTYVHYQDPNNDYDCVGDSCSLTAVSAGNTIQFLCQ